MKTMEYNMCSKVRAFLFEVTIFNELNNRLEEEIKLIGDLNHFGFMTF